MLDRVTQMNSKVIKSLLC